MFDFQPLFNREIQQKNEEDDDPFDDYSPEKDYRENQNAQ